MKITFVGTGSLERFSPNIRTFGLAHAMARRGHEIHIILPNCPENQNQFATLREKGIKGHLCRPGSLEVSTKLQLLSHLKPEIIHCIDGWTRNFLPGLMAKWVTGCRLVMDIGEWESRLPQLKHKLYAIHEYMCPFLVDALICASSYLTKEMRVRTAKKNIYYLPYGIDPNTFEVKSNLWLDIRRQFEPAKLLVHLGSFYPNRSLEDIGPMIQLLVQDRKDVMCLLIGSGPDRHRVERMFESLGLDHFVQFLGFIPSSMIPAYLRAAHVLLFPILDTVTNRARCPNKTFLYLAARRPIVTNPVGEVKTALGKDAFFFSSGNSQNFRDKVLEALKAKEEEIDRRMEYRIQLHSWKVRAHKYEVILENLGL